MAQVNLLVKIVFEGSSVNVIPCFFISLTITYHLQVSVNCKIILKFATWDAFQRLLISKCCNLGRQMISTVIYIATCITFQQIWYKLHFIMGYKTFNFFHYHLQWVDAVCLFKINHRWEANTKKHYLKLTYLWISSQCVHHFQ